MYMRNNEIKLISLQQSNESVLNEAHTEGKTNDRKYSIMCRMEVLRNFSDGREGQWRAKNIKRSLNT